MWSSASFTASNPYACDSDAYIPNEKVNLQSSNESIADTERNVKVRGTTNSKIPSIFDYVICNSSIIKSYYHQKNLVIWLKVRTNQPQGSEIRPNLRIQQKPWSWYIG